MSKDVENGPLAFELARFENIFVPKPAVGTNFRQVKYFLVVDEKIDYILRFWRRKTILFRKKFVPEAVFRWKYFQNELAQRPVNRF